LRVIPDLASPEVLQQPYAAYDTLRREAPVLHDPRSSAWFISRYADTAAVLADAETFASSGAYRANTLIGMDGEAHARLRKVAQRSFTLAQVRALEAPIRAFVEERIAAMRSRGQCDLVAELAAPLPRFVVARLLGVDPAHGDDLQRWADRMVARDAAAAAECAQFLSRHLPHDAHDELSRAERIAVATFLVVAGSESTFSFIGSAALFLARDLALQERLRAEPALIDAFLDEVLRYESPAQRLWRVTRRATRLGAAQLPEGARVVALVGSANRDPEMFPRAEEFDPQRRPNRHLAFGIGPHFCLGAQLTRLETAVAVGALVHHVPRLRLARPEEPIRYKASFSVRAPERLELELGA
jgi:cytochrome P450